MKKIFCVLLAAVFLSINLYAQDTTTDPELKNIKRTVKKGWIIGPLPAVGYTSDQGFQYGILTDIFYFGNGSTYPKYIHKFNIELSRYTKGSGVYHLFFDTESKEDNIRATFDVSYLTDKMMDFYGFNGYKSSYNPDNPSVFYKLNRSLFRATSDFQGPLGGHFKWAFGLGYYKYKIKSAEQDSESSDNSLYDEMVANGMIEGTEKDGGQIIEFKGGLVLDTRDIEADPTRGFYTHIIFTTSPPIRSSNMGYSRISLIHRGYVSTLNNSLTFAYRLGYQNRTGGKIPFYALQNITTLYFSQITSEGLGGINTVRGVLRNRIIGNGILWSNIELRYRFCDFKFFGQDWYLVLNPFADAGKVTENYPTVDQLVYDFSTETSNKEKLHWSAGAGIKAIMAKNFVISAEFGKPFNKQDGKNGMNIGLNYIF